MNEITTVFLTGGYAPDINKPVIQAENAEIPLARSLNIFFEDREAHTELGREVVYTLANIGKQFFFYTYLNDNIWLYLYQGNTIYRVQQNVSTFSLLPLVNVTSNYTKFAQVAWDNCVFISAPDVPLRKLSGMTTYQPDTRAVPELPRTLCARYMINADDHLMLANVRVNNERAPYQLIWSDLYNPEDFHVGADSEAGSFLLTADDLEITGLSYQRGSVKIYSRNKIWIANYVGLDNGVFQFERLYDNIGNIYHHSVISVNDLDFFIGKNNFYILDGLAALPIGNEVWDMFRNTISPTDRETEVRGFASPTETKVWWQFIANGNYGTVNGQSYRLVYDYVHSKWSLHNTDGIVDIWETDTTGDTGETWSENNLMWDEEVKTWDQTSEPFLHKKLFLRTGDILKEIDTRRDVGGGYKVVSLETIDILLDNPFNSVEIYDVKLIGNHTNMLSSLARLYEHDITLRVGFRENLHKSITWSDPIHVAEDTYEEDNLIFRLRNLAQTGKFLRFRLTATNQYTHYLSTIVGLTISYRKVNGSYEK